MADAILDTILAHDEEALVGCEVTACPNMLHIMGEVTSSYSPDYESIARKTLGEIGYTVPDNGFDADTCSIRVDVHGQSPDITRSVERISSADAGAGDQGVVFGYACDETSCFMPLPITLAHALARHLEQARRSRLVEHLLPDGKAQVSLEYDNDRPVRIAAVVISAQHGFGADIDDLRDQITDRIIIPALPKKLVDDSTALYVNPTGRFVAGGPFAHTGLTGRKTMVDLYGGTTPGNGSSLAGKDPSKTNRSGTYMARYLAKNIVAAKLARRCEVRIAYAIGLADPICLSIDTFDTGCASEEELAAWVQHSVDLRPAMIIRRFDLRRPIYQVLSCYGHVGENALGMPWEQTDLATHLVSAFG